MSKITNDGLNDPMGILPGDATGGLLDASAAGGLICLSVCMLACVTLSVSITHCDADESD